MEKRKEKVLKALNLLRELEVLAKELEIQNGLSNSGSWDFSCALKKELEEIELTETLVGVEVAERVRTLLSEPELLPNGVKVKSIGDGKFSVAYHSWNLYGGISLQPKTTEEVSARELIRRFC